MSNMAVHGRITAYIYQAAGSKTVFKMARRPSGTLSHGRYPSLYTRRTLYLGTPSHIYTGPCMCTVCWSVREGACTGRCQGGYLPGRPYLPYQALIWPYIPYQALIWPYMALI